MDRWRELAARWCIEPGYFDTHGRWWDATDEALRRVVEALSAPGNPAAAALDAQRPVEAAYQGDGRRLWVLAVQLYAVRSRRNWGHGDFTDLAALLEVVADLGGAGIGLNPLHALFYDGLGSPYSPSSRLFLNPLYVDVEAVEDLRREDTEGLVAEIERLRAAELIDYAPVARLKLAAMRVAYRNFVTSGSAARRADFDKYRSARGHALECFAAFETLRSLHPGGRTTWPEAARRPDDALLRGLRERCGDEMGFHEFLQWNAERQLERCRDVARRRGLAIGLYLDTAIGVDPSGADAWMGQDALLYGLSIGAPPDQFNPAGQDWGLTAYNPHGLVATDFGPFRQMLRAAMRCAGAVRLDHVLGLMRLFVIPRGLGAQGGVYLRLPFASMLAVVAEESRHWRCIVIGEDLGTVPEGFRATLSSWGLWSYLVMMFERHGDGSFKRTDDYPEKAIATFNTHDLATFAGWMSGHDLAQKRAIGVNPGESDDDRRRAREAFAAAVGKTEPRFADAVAYLAATRTRLMSVAIEDVLEMADQVNMPGTVEQYPNWRRRWPIALEELAGDQRLRTIAATLSRAGRGSAGAT